MAKILIVDDSKTVRFGLRKTLEKGGHDIIEAEDGSEAIKVATEDKTIQLMIIDFNMPRMDGITASKNIHNLPNYTKLPTFMLTTETSEELKASAKEAGVIAWLVKPFNKEKLLKYISKVV